MRVLSRLLAIAAVGGALSAVSATASAESTSTPVGNDQLSLVEDYPGADQIFAAYGVRLTSGDGHILFADCSTPPTNNVGTIRVHTTEPVGIHHDGLVCFKVTADTGHWELDLPAVYEIRGDGRTQGTGHKLRAELVTDDGTHTAVKVNPSGSTPVGVGTSPDSPPTTLLALDVSS